METEAFRQCALSLGGVEEIAHFNRRAFRARRIFASLAADGTANILLSPEQQETFVSIHPNVLRRLPNKWGDRGWTQLRLGAVPVELAEHLLHLAWKDSI